MDKIIKKNTLFGIAISQDHQHTDIGQLGTNIKSESNSITVYSSWHKSRSAFIDSLIGYGYINNDLKRIEQANTSNILTGSRDIQQYFTSIKFNKIINRDKFTSLFFGRDFNIGTNNRISSNFH